MVLVAGVLTMHGFLAVSAGAVGSSASFPDAHAAGHPAGPVMASTMVTSPAAGDAPLQGPDGAPPSSPHPADHHASLAGCVVALVGVAVLALVHLLARHRPLGAGRPPVTVPRVLTWFGDHAPALPPPRIALCVLRV